MPDSFNSRPGVRPCAQEARPTSAELARRWRTSVRPRTTTLDLNCAMPDRFATRVLCPDGAFAGNDQIKAKVVQIRKAIDVTSSRTV